MISTNILSIFNTVDNISPCVYISQMLYIISMSRIPIEYLDNSKSLINVLWRIIIINVIIGIVNIGLLNLIFPEYPISVLIYTVYTSYIVLFIITVLLN